MKKLKLRETYTSEIYKGEEFDRLLAAVEYFDLNENLIESKSYNEAGQVTTVERREYEANILTLIEVHEVEVDQIHKTEFNYNENNLIEEEIEHYQNGTFFKTVYTYNSSNQIVEILKTDEENQFLGVEIYSYENDVQTIEKYDDENFCFEKTTLLLDSLRRETEKNQIDYYSDIYEEDEREISTTTHFEYKGDYLVNERSHRFDNRIFEKSDTYDSRGNLKSSIIFNIEVDFEIRVDYAYDARNQLISEIEYTDMKPVFSKYKKYDAHNNLVEEIENVLMVDEIVKTFKRAFINMYY